MQKCMAEVGMKVKITKYDASEERHWAPSQASRHVGLVCEVVSIHDEHPAVHLRLRDPIIGEVQWWWYHTDDVQPAENHGKKYKKKVTFNPQQLIVGV